MKILYFFTLVFLIVCRHTVSVAQQDTTNQSKDELAEVEIIASKTVNSEPLLMAKAPVKPLDMPQSMIVISNELISNQQGARLSDVLKNTNGIAIGTTRGSVSENFYARGYSLGANNILRNGLRASASSLAEASTLERVEVLKGSAALLYGGVSGGAVVNLVTKQPKFNYGGEISMRAGSYSYYKPIVDFYGPITKRLAFRIVSTYENSKSYRNNVHNDRIYVNPSLLFKITDKTSLIVQGDYLHYENTPDFGVGSLAGQIPRQISRSSFFNTPWAYNKVNQTTSSATLNHAINDKINFNLIAGYQVFNREYFSTERIQANARGDWGRNLTRSKTSEQYLNAQMNISGKFNTGFLNHVLLLGTDAEQYVNVSNGFTSIKTYDTINILNPEKFIARTDMPETANITTTRTPTYRFGYYVQDLIHLSRQWKILTGIRWSYQKAVFGKINYLEKDSIGRTASPTKYDRAFSPRVGIVYQPIRTTSVFLSYSNNFVTNTGRDIYDANLKPSNVNQYEFGIKNDLINGRLAVNLNFYKIVNSDLAQMAPYLLNGKENIDPNIKEFTGQTTSDGFELDIMGKICDNLNVVAGYSYNHMRYTKTSMVAGSYIKGEQLVNNTPHTANTTLFYTFKSTFLKGVKAGISGYYTGSRLGGWNNKVGQEQKESRLIEVNSFTTFDFTLGYTYKQISILGKISNITNELNYYVHENYSINPIPPRQFMTTLSYRF